MSSDQRDLSDHRDLEVWIDQELCTGDGICAQYAPDVFELDVDGLAYVKDEEDTLRHAQGSAVPLPLPLVQDVVDSVRDCPGQCIHVRRTGDAAEVYGPQAGGT